MIRSPCVTAVAFTPARELDVQTGLLGFVACNVDALRVDGIAFRRAENGRNYLRFPTKRKGSGREFQIVWPADDAARVAIESQILAALRAHGVTA